ncbi:MAG: S4 domain-containing protein [Gammaproteobacteria bacterium]|nr:S4 domain-containing protein [Gammaproteobacteria bacterium]
MSDDKNIDDDVRLDKWLWAARFFKTRSQAAEAVNGGKVHVNGVRGKCSRKMQIGDKVQITRGIDVYQVTVLDLADKRGSAALAQSLYEESEESIKRRTEESAMRKLLNVSGAPAGRPSKRDRREIRRVKGH